MTRLKAMDKARLLVDNENVALMSETPNYEYWIVKGNARDVYEIIYHKYSGEYTCTCKNIRLTPCSHIQAITIEKEEKEDELC